MIISEMQHKLATWSDADHSRRFDRLLRLITDRNWLVEAARIVLASRGAHTPGLDGMDKRRLEVGLDQHLDRLRANLLDGSYRPTPVKRIYIPKTNGKLRPLGIPTATSNCTSLPSAFGLGGSYSSLPSASRPAFCSPKSQNGIGRRNAQSP